MDNQLEISGLIKPIYETYKTLSDEWKNLFDVGLYDYLNTQTEKFYFTNTFIHRGEKVVFAQIYHPIKASYKKLSTDFGDLAGLFKDYKNITLVGSAGSGKTTVVKYIYLKAIEEKTKIPILIELRNLNEYDGDFEQLITDRVLKSKMKPNDVTFKRALDSGKFLFLLDGYDEIFSVKKQLINQQIETFVDNYSKNNFLITTRPGSGIESFPRFYDFNVQELKKNEVIQFVTKLVDNQEKKKRILKSIRDNNSYSEYLRNPLLLSMYIMAFESHPEIPKRKSSFYRNVFDTLYSKHDGITKNSFLREKITKLQMDDFEGILSSFCYLTLLQGQYSFTFEQLYDVLQKVKKAFNLTYNTEHLIDDFRTSISILILDGFEYSFPHRSMQEYFTALFLSRLPTNKKSKAYSNLAKTLEESSTDNSFNFWNLCKEMDETVFLSTFLIPQLKRIRKKFAYTGDVLFDKFIELYGMELYKNDAVSVANGENEMLLVRTPCFDTSIINFSIENSFGEIWDFIEDSDCEKELKQAYLREMSDDRFLPISSSPEIKRILLAYGFMEKIKDLGNKIDLQIEKFQIKINKNIDSIDDLLRL